MTQRFRFCTLTLDVYDGSRRAVHAPKMHGEAPYLHRGKPDLAAARKKEDIDSADEGGGSSLATSVHSSAPALPAAGDSCVLRTAPDALHTATAASTTDRVDCDPHNAIDSARPAARAKQQQHAAGLQVSEAAAQGMQQVIIRQNDSSGSTAVASSHRHSSGPTVPHQTAIESQALSLHSGVQSSRGAPLNSCSSARPVLGAGVADHSERPAALIGAEAVGMTPAVEPSEGFHTSTAVWEHHGVHGDSGAGAAVAGSVAVHVEGASGAGDEMDSGQEKALVLREPARFAALKTRSLWRQLASAEAIGLTLFFTAHVLILQLYLGAPSVVGASVQHMQARLPLSWSSLWARFRAWAVELCP